MVYAPSQTAPKRVIGALAATLAVVAFVAVTHDQASGSKTASTPTSLAASTELTPCIQWAGHKDTFDEPGMGGCAATSVLVQCVTWQGHQWQAPDSDTYHGLPGMTIRPGACAAAIALSAKTKGIATTCKHVGKIAKLPATELTPCIEWAGPGGSTIGANHFGGGPMGGCAALSTELLAAHKKCTATTDLESVKGHKIHYTGPAYINSAATTALGAPPPSPYPKCPAGTTCRCQGAGYSQCGDPVDDVFCC